jgi:hypothetical protein
MISDYLLAVKERRGERENRRKGDGEKGGKGEQNSEL